jgi:hypothetical protein
MSNTTYKILQTKPREFLLNLPPLSYEQASSIAAALNTHMEEDTWITIPLSREVKPESSIKDTLSVVYTEWGTTLARYCLESKRWYRYSDGRHLRGTVDMFLPVSKVDWQDATWGGWDTFTLYLAQGVSGRYLLASHNGNSWVCASNERVLREELVRLVRVKDMKEGSWKNT